MEIIAEKPLILVDPSGEQVPFVIRFGKPYQLNGREWACPVKAPALHIGNHDIRGADSFQALVMAQCFLRQTMLGKVKDGIAFMNPEDGLEVEVPALFGSRP